MSRSAGNVIVVGALLAWPACGEQADAWIEVSRTSASAVSVQLCPPSSPSGCRNSIPVFTKAEDVDVVHTVGIYLDSPAERLAVRFTQLELDGLVSNTCHQVALPFDGAMRDLRVTIPATEGEPLAIRDCDDCVSEACQ